MEIIVTKNYNELSGVAAKMVIDQINKKKTSILGLATGNTVLGFYKELVKAYHRKEIDFKKIKTFNLDEFVGLDDTDHASLFYFMRKNFFDKVNLNPRNVNMLDGRAKNLNVECKKFDEQIKKSKGIDLQILGIGLNGHIGWNEPGSGFKSKTRVLNLTLSSRRAQSGNFENLRQVPKKAMTIGMGAIMEAKKIMLMASGENKADIVAKALTGKVRKKVPASILQRHPNLTVVLDEAAAAKLHKSVK